MGTIVIGYGQGRTVTPEEAGDMAGMQYTVMLSGPGGTKTRTIENGGTIELSPGPYQVSVRAVNADGRLRGLTEQRLTIAGGGTYNITIPAVIGVSTFAQLKAALTSTAELTGGGPFTDTSHPQNVIVLEDSFDITGQINVGTGKYTLVAEPGETFTLTRGSVHTGALINTGTAELILGSAAGLTGNIVIDGNHVSGVGSSLVTVSGGSLTMNSGVTLKNNDNSTPGGAVSVSNVGSFTMAGGEVSGNSASNGGGVYVATGTFTMSGTAEITGNKADDAISGSGGGVYFGSTGTFTMLGGAIRGGGITNAINGGGVYVAAGTFAMSGTAEITGNKTVSTGTSTAGGGVYIDSGSTFTISGRACISANEARTTNTTTNIYGGGVFIGTGGSFEMSDNAVIGSNKTILGNDAFGGGVYSQGTFKMTGGKITDNQLTSVAANKFGGGVYIGSASSTAFVMEGGTISKNEAARGGGVCMNGVGVFAMLDGAIISGNISSDIGGGVYLRSGTFNMSDGTIGGSQVADKNTAATGGGIYIADGTFNMSDNAKISGNETRQNGAGVYISSGSGNFIMTGGQISGNNITASATYTGSGVYMSGGNFSINSPAARANIFGNTGGNPVSQVNRAGGNFMVDGTSTGSY